VKASQAADPLAIPALVIVAVEGVAIAKGAHGIAHGIIAAFETRQRVIILLVMAHVNRAEGMQVVMDKTQDLVKAFTRIADDFQSCAGESVAGVPGNLGWSGDDHCDWRGLGTCRRSKVNQSLVLADQAVLADPTARRCQFVWIEFTPPKASQLG
jgi:hypothetical protein